MSNQPDNQADEWAPWEEQYAEYMRGQTASKHRPICSAYWDRGLDCPCIPQAVKDAIRAGANPDDVL
jgi:hypothetical protein